MTPIPQKIRKQIDSLPFYKVCSKACIQGHSCKGKITMDHTIIFAGKQLQELWSIIPVCEYGHGVNGYQDNGDINKEVHLWIALNRATIKDLVMISKAVNYVKELDRLNKKYGSWSEQMAIDSFNSKSPDAKDGIAMWFPLSKDLKYMVDLIISNEKTYLGLTQSPFNVIIKAIHEYHQRLLDDIEKNK